MIGNIVTLDKIKVDDNFNVVNSFNEVIEGIPTLVVGTNNANDSYGNLNYIDRKIDDLNYWTFSKKEKRGLFEEDLFYFIENSYKNLTNRLEYIFVDVILFDDEKIKKIFDKIESYKDNISFLTDKMVYIYSDKYIFGIDLRQIEYIRGDIDKFIKKVKRFSKDFLSNNEILIEYKNNLGMLEDELKYIPVLYSMRRYG
jgi:hypothetical protein|tara:strand:- start:1348 stop:1944 length:597 start_codon:yes stop_codon:yes gene_type:complete